MRQSDPLEKANALVPDFLPFRGTRYRGSPDLSALTAPPYDVIDEEERAALEEAHPHNAVRLILPRETGRHDAYAAAASTFEAWREKGVLAVDPTARYYGYRMRYTDGGVARHTVGVIGALGLGDAEHGVLPHERTMHKARSDRLALLEATRANFDPIWGLSLAGSLSRLIPDEPVVATAMDVAGTRHELIPIDEPGAIAAITDAVRSAPVVLADGHHRYETARAYREQHSRAPGVDAIMALVVELTDDELCVHPIHRVLTGVRAGSLHEQLGHAFDVVDAGPNALEGLDQLVRRMHDEAALGIVERDRFALATPREDALDAIVRDLPAPLRDLDATRFDAGILPALGEVDVAYRDDAATVATLVGKGAADAAVLLRPVTVPQIRAAAFAGVRMPQKTTFFYPKPRTGIVFRSLDD